MAQALISRRAVLAATAAFAGTLAAPRVSAEARARLVIVGGGFGGASAARFARDAFPDAEVTLIERSRSFNLSLRESRSRRDAHGREHHLRL